MPLNFGVVDFFLSCLRGSEQISFPVTIRHRFLSCLRGSELKIRDGESVVEFSELPTRQ